MKTNARRHVGAAVMLAAILAAPIDAATAAAAAVVPTAVGTAGGLSVYVGYAEDKETNNPQAAAFPVPWAGAPNTLFLGGTVPGQSACGTLTVCYDAGAIRLDNPGTAPVTVSQVAVDIHSSITGGKVFNNLWGTFTVPAGQSVILTENPPTTNPTYDNFDTSGYPGNHCTPVTVAPTVTITIDGVVTTLADSTHVLDTGGIDAGFCKLNESIQWRPIGAPGSATASLTLGTPGATAYAGQSVTQIATLLDGGGAGIPNAAVHFTVTNGPNAGLSGSTTTDRTGNASFTYSSIVQGEDVITAAVTSVGTFQSAPARVLWTSDTTAGWTGTDIANATPPGDQSLDATGGLWTIHGGGAGITGTTDQFHYLSKTLPGNGGIGAHLTPTGAPGATTGVMLRTTTDPGSIYYAAIVAPDGGITIQDRTAAGGPTTTVATQAAGTVPAFLWVGSSNGVLTAYTSSDGYQWYPVTGSNVTLNVGQTFLAGIAVTSRDGTQISTAIADDVAVSPVGPAPPPPVPCPAPWTCADIGNPTPTGNQSFDPTSGVWTVNAGGADITGTADQFRYLWQPRTGDGTVTAQVATQANTSSSAKTGVMIRATADPGSPYYGVFVTPGTGIKVQRRSTQGASTMKLANPTGTAPVYLRVTRVGNSFIAYTSADGLSWTPIPGSNTTLSLPAATLQGVAVTSHNSGKLGTVTIANAQSTP